MQNLAFSIVPIESIADDCVNCGICVKECAFLQEYGSPQKLAESWLKKENIGNKQFSFECSLCGLCHGVCPKKLDPSAMFLAMRRQLVSEGNGRLSEHNTIRAYEKRGSSSTFSWFHFPENCHTVLFPGCAFPGSRSGTLTYLFEMLQKAIPELGIVFDCCTKPSHDLGEQIYFEKMFGELCAILRKNSVTKVLVTCPNCYRIFREYGEGIEVETVYELLARRGVAIGGRKLAVTIHDPCGVRFSPQVQESIRTLMSQQGTTVQEMEHNCEKTYCCGEGGSAGFIRADFAKGWTQKRVAEAGSDDIISYCAGCTHFLGGSSTTHHLLDFLFFPEAVAEGRQKVSKAPFTYWNRFRLKRVLQKKLRGGLSGTRKQLRK